MAGEDPVVRSAHANHDVRRRRHMIHSRTAPEASRNPRQAPALPGAGAASVLWVTTPNANSMLALQRSQWNLRIGHRWIPAVILEVRRHEQSLAQRMRHQAALRPGMSHECTHAAPGTCRCRRHRSIGRSGDSASGDHQRRGATARQARRRGRPPCCLPALRQPFTRSFNLGIGCAPNCSWATARSRPSVCVPG